MHPTQHSTIHRRGPAPVSHNHGVECTHDDILDAIAQIAAQQSTCFVMIATVAFALGLHDEDDRAWLLTAIEELDRQQRVMLNSLEKPQALASVIAPWHVRNASGIPCHEICVAPDSHRLKPLLQQHAPELPFMRAPNSSSNNPMMQKRRVSALVAGAAAILFSTGSRPHTQFRVLHVEQNDGRAA